MKIYQKFVLLVIRGFPSDLRRREVSNRTRIAFMCPILRSHGVITRSVLAPFMSSLISYLLIFIKQWISDSACSWKLDLNKGNLFVGDHLLSVKL